MTPASTHGSFHRMGLVTPLLMLCCLLLGGAANMFDQQTTQVASVACFVAAAAWLLVTSRVKSVRLSAFEMLLIVCCVVSAFMSSWMAIYAASIYSFMLLACMISVALVVRGMTLQQMFSIFVTASAIMVALPLFFQTRELAAALALNVGVMGLERFTPLNMHPNLAGFVYGGIAIMLWFRATLSLRWPGKILFVGLSGLAAIYMMAASSRSALLGTAVVGAIYFVVLISSPAVHRTTKLVTLGLVAVAGLALLSVSSILGYISGVLEVNSDSRGVGSGASGRSELWARGVDMLTSDPARMLFGYGFRSSEPTVTGFPVESSYINIALEVGLVAGTILVAMYLISAIRMIAIGHSGRFGKDGTIYLAFGLMTIFFMMHSIFNRYLLGVGNPMSLISLLALAAFNCTFPIRSVRPAQPVDRSWATGTPHPAP